MHPLSAFVAESPIRRGVLFSACLLPAACGVGAGGAWDSGPFAWGGGDATGRFGAASESCDNGLDDDGDGLIDEECPCEAGQTKSCWPFSGLQRGRGACHDGMQVCAGGEWGSCFGFAGPSREMPDNTIDEDCDGDLGPCTPLGVEGTTCGRVPCPAEVCGDGIDNDCDSLADAARLEVGSVRGNREYAWL